MKVAVTGGSGFIGSFLVERLEKAGHEVVSLDIRKGRPSTVQCHHAIDVRNSEEAALEARQRASQYARTTRVIVGHGGGSAGCRSSL
jgi:nucleoside-diphosphate-sugar epimerase